MPTSSTDERNGSSDQLRNFKESPDKQITLDELSCNSNEKTRRGVNRQVCNGPVDVEKNILAENNVRNEQIENECGKVGKVWERSVNCALKSDDNTNRTKIESSVEKVTVDKVSEQKVSEAERKTNGVAECITEANVSKDIANGHCKILLDENNNIVPTKSFVEKANDIKTNDVDSVSTNSEEDEVEEGLIVKQISEGFLTQSMLQQEKELHKQNMEEEKEIVNQVSFSLKVRKQLQN